MLSAVVPRRNAVHVILPAHVDDPGRPSGGNVYDRRLSAGLTASGWSVREHHVPGRWPAPDRAAHGALRSALASVPADGVVLVDGLLASRAPAVITPQVTRLPIVVLLHVPAGDAEPSLRSGERAVLAGAAAVVTTSRWTRRWVLDHYGLPPHRVHVAEPGVETRPAAPLTSAGDRLLCVGVVAPHKGHDVLVEALGELRDLSWTCRLVGPLDRVPCFVARLRGALDRRAIADRVQLRGPLTGRDLDAAYAGADVLVHASRGETYGMVVAEALAHGRPVVATSVGGVPETLGCSPAGRRPGLLVPPDDAGALASAMRRYLGDESLRRDLRHAATERSRCLPTWSDTVSDVAPVLARAHDSLAAAQAP